MSPSDGRAHPAPLRLLVEHARPHRRAMALSLLLTLAASAAGLAQPLVAQQVLRALEGSGRWSAQPILLLVALLVAGTALSGVNAWLQQRTAERVVRAARRRLTSRLIRITVAERDRSRPGDLMSRVTSDTALLQDAVGSGVIMVINGTVSAAAALVLMGSLHVGLLAATVAVLALSAVVVTVVLPRIRRAVVSAQSAVGEVGSVIDRVLGALTLVKSHGGEDAETARAHAATERAYRAGLTTARHSALIAVLSGLSVQASFLVVLGIGGYLVGTGALATSALIAFLLYVFYLAGPLASLSNGLRTVQDGLAAAVRIDEVRRLDAEDDLSRPPYGRGDPRGAATLRLDGVHFAYPDRAPVLRGLSLDVGPHGTTALVGPSGAGKSTVFSLLQRFYEPEAGRILVDGVPVTGTGRGRLRRDVALVAQESPVVDGTIRDNLCYGYDETDPSAIADALRETGLDELVRELPHGLDTPVGPRGVLLSGGERQRLALARALLRDPRVLLLDEVTAHLDGRNEQALRRAVDRVARRCTVLMIAHRTATVVACDRIVLIDGGRVADQGSHPELVGRSALYRELIATQLTPDAAPTGTGV